MSVYWYDNAIVNTFRVITGDKRIAINSTDNLFRYVANLDNDQVTLPLINLVRLGYRLLRVTRNPLSSDGFSIGSAGNKVDRMQAIPIHIEYQLDIITRNREDNDTITSELIFYLTNHPTLKVHINRGANVDHNFNIFINDEIPDNSDLESHQRNGEYFRSTLRLYVPDAYLWKTTSDTLKLINPIVVLGTTDADDESKVFMKETIDIYKENA